MDDITFEDTSERAEKASTDEGLAATALQLGVICPRVVSSSPFQTYHC